MIGEILELDEDAWEYLSRSGDKLVHQFVIRLTGDAFLAQADVIGIVQQALIVGADVEHHRQAELGVNAGAGRVERKLADRNAHAVGAKIAEAQDALAVGHHNQLGGVRPVSQNRRDTSAIVGADEQAARPLEDVAEPLAGEPDRRGINERLNLVDIVGNDTEEQRLVAVMQRVEGDIFLKVVGLLAQISQHALGLRLNRKHMGRQKSAQTERIALLVGEARAFVEKRIAQQRHPVRLIGLGRRSGRPRERVHGGSPAKFNVR